MPGDAATTQFAGPTVQVELFATHFKLLDAQFSGDVVWYFFTMSEGDANIIGMLVNQSKTT